MDLELYDFDIYGQPTLCTLEVAISIIADHGNYEDLGEILSLSVDQIELSYHEYTQDSYHSINLYILLLTGYVRQFENVSLFRYFQFIPSSIIWLVCHLIGFRAMELKVYCPTNAIPRGDHRNGPQRVKYYGYAWITIEPAHDEHNIIVPYY